MQVEEIMSRDVITVLPEDTVEKAALLMLQHHVGGLPVIDADGRPVGMVTEGDLIRRAADFEAPGYLPILGAIIYLDDPLKFVQEMRQAMSLHIGGLMSTDLYTVNPGDTLTDAATLMLRQKVKRLPVVDQEGRLTGILSRRDLVAALYPLEEGSRDRS